MNIRTALVLAFLCARSFGATAIGTGQSADVVLGQADFVSKLAPAAPTAASMNSPSFVVVDPASGKVFVSDTQNNRVLRFSSSAAMANGSAAEAVLGQAGFTTKGAATTQKEMDSPYGLAIDANGTLWVADSGNHRILRFDAAATKPAAAVNADGVLGQAMFNTKTAANPPTQASLNTPRGLAVDTNGTLWVADAGNHRVLRFDTAATAINGANAGGVLGAPAFNVNFGGVATQYAMNTPSAVAADSSGHLWVAEFGNNRVLRFDDAAHLANGALAAAVLGQPDFLTNTALSTPAASSLNHPDSVAVDAAGALWIADTFNSRALRFDTAASKPNGAGADAVLGKTDFVTKGPLTTQDGLGAPFGVYIDAAGGLWLGDTFNHRVLHYTPQTVAASSPAPVALAIRGKKKFATAASKITVKGSASCANGIARVEYRIGKKGGFRIASGTTSWSFRAKLAPGRNSIAVRAVSGPGLLSAPEVLQVSRE